MIGFLYKNENIYLTFFMWIGGWRTWKSAEVFEVILSVYEIIKKIGVRFIGMVKKGFEQSSEIEIRNVTAS
jgi:hypothetical protein